MRFVKLATSKSPVGTLIVICAVDVILKGGLKLVSDKIDMVNTPSLASNT